MSPHKTITVNGRVYDAVTGLPVEGGQATPTTKAKTPAKPLKAASAAKPRQAHPAAQVHGSAVQRSQTLNRRAAKKPASLTKQPSLRPAAGRHMDIAKHAQVSRFASHPVVAQEKPQHATKQVAKSASPDRPTPKHPTVERALAKVAAKKPSVKPAVTAKQVKDAEIAKALEQPKAKKPKQKLSARLSKKTRIVLIIVSIILALAIVVMGVYKFFPSVSVRVAAAQAGISASYPEFTPDGYSLSQPVTYKEGEVDLKFTSNSNDNYYTISQSRNSWDSSAVLDNIVTPAAGANYSITKERGLTIYMYDSSAAWVNGGILYKIDSKAALSGDQIRRIATSL